MLLEGRFHRFVELGERPVFAAWPEERALAVLLHDEGVFGAGVAAAVHHVADPLAVAPLDDRLVRVPRAALLVHGGAVVDDAAVHGPCVGPVREQADLFLFRRLRLVAAGHHVALVRPRARVQPVAAGGGAVGLQHGEGGDLMPGLVQLAADGHVAQEVAVHDLGGVGGRELVPFHPLVDAEAKDRFGEDAALLLIELADGEHHFDHDVAVGLGFAVTVGAGIAPLHPAA